GQALLQFLVLFAKARTHDGLWIGFATAFGIQRSPRIALLAPGGDMRAIDPFTATERGSLDGRSRLVVGEDSRLLSSREATAPRLRADLGIGLGGVRLHE